MKILVLIGALLFSQIIYAKNYMVEALANKDGERMVFTPSFLQIQPRDQVTFLTGRHHNSMSLVTPEGARGWSVAGTSVVKFDKEGIYFYKCSPHLGMGMVGVIVVGEPVNKEESIREMLSYKEKELSMNKNRIDDLIEQINQL